MADAREYVSRPDELGNIHISEEVLAVIAAAAALAVLDILDDETIRQVKEKGMYLRSAIETMGAPCVRGTRGMGLMIGVEVCGDRSHKELAARLIDSGLLCLTAGKDVLRLLPPLTITKEEMDQGLDILRSVLAE